jgi:hypothetical protein
VRPTSPAYKTFDIKPLPNKALGHAKCSIETRNGIIRSSWAYGDGEIRYVFEIPHGTVAHMTLVDGTDKVLTAGRYTFVTAE